MARITQRQREVLRAIEKLETQHGRGPTYAELAQELHLRSRSSIFPTIQRLKKHGLLRNDRRIVIQKGGNDVSPSDKPRRVPMS